MFLRISLALLELIAVAASMNVTYFFWKRLKKPEMAKVGEEEVPHLKRKKKRKLRREVDRGFL